MAGGAQRERQRRQFADRSHGRRHARGQSTAVDHHRWAVSAGQADDGPGREEDARQSTERREVELRHTNGQTHPCAVRRGGVAHGNAGEADRQPVRPQRGEVHDPTPLRDGDRPRARRRLGAGLVGGAAKPPAGTTRREASVRGPASSDAGQDGDRRPRAGWPSGARGSRRQHLPPPARPAGAAARALAERRPTHCACRRQRRWLPASPGGCPSSSWP